VSLPLITVSLFVGAVSIVVAIVRLGFLDVNFIVRRGLVYTLASAIIVAVYLAAGRRLDRLTADLVGAPVPLLETTFLVLGLFLLQPLLSGVEHLVDRGYARDRADLRNALTRLSGQVSLLLDPGEVARVVASTVRREMVLDSAAVVWRDRRTGVFTLVVSRAELVTLPNWQPGLALFAALEGRHDAVRVGELLEAPRSRGDRELLAGTLGDLGAQLAFPLVAGAPDSGASGEIVGVLLLGRKITQTRIPFEETALVSFIARQVGTSLMNGAMHQEQMESRLLQEEVATARRIQQQLLPEEPPNLPGWEVAASNSPSRHVGGDYHDFLPLPGGILGVAIADVSGKGVPAALLMSNLQAALRGRMLAETSIEAIVRDVNRTMCRNTGAESFISFFLGSLDPGNGVLRYTNAGHNAPLLVRSDGTVEALEDGGLLLGVFPEATYEEGQVELYQGDLLVMYTDGVTEASNAAGDMYSEKRLVESLVKWRGHDASGVHRRLLDEVRTFQDGLPPDDDLTVILLKRTSGVPDESTAPAAALARGGAQLG
jgi:serine phosphatase RsbU (regulator of sigma subunit)